MGEGRINEFYIGPFLPHVVKINIEYKPKGKKL